MSSSMSSEDSPKRGWRRKDVSRPFKRSRLASPLAVPKKRVALQDQPPSCSFWEEPECFSHSVDSGDERHVLEARRRLRKKRVVSSSPVVAASGVIAASSATRHAPSFVSSGSSRHTPPYDPLGAMRQKLFLLVTLVKLQHLRSPCLVQFRILLLPPCLKICFWRK